MRFVFLSLLLIASAMVNAQPTKEYIEENTRPVVSIDWRDTTNTDLDVIGDAIGDARVVLLGEQDHGDAPAFLAKTRLVRYLHEKKGFTVIAMESDFYGLVQAEREVRAGKITAWEGVMSNTFTIWTKAQECQDFFSYIADSYKTTHPLRFAGFDSQLHGYARAKGYKTDFLSRVDAAWHDALTPLLNDVQRYYPLHQVDTMQTSTLARYEKLIDSLEKSVNLPDSSFTRIMIRSLRGYLAQQNHFRNNSYLYNTVRDKQMAENFVYLYRYLYPNEKIIVWAHNYHVLKNSDVALTHQSGRHHSMGSELYRQLKDSIYIVGFTSWSGKAGRGGTKAYRIHKPKPESVESWMAKPGYPYAFVDIGRFRQQHPGVKEVINMKGKSHDNASAYWTEIYDGIFYIKDMYPVSPVKR